MQYIFHGGPIIETNLILHITSRETTFNPLQNLALVPVFFAPGTRETFSPGWYLQPGLKVPAQRLLRQAFTAVQGPLVPVEATNQD